MKQFPLRKLLVAVDLSHCSTAAWKEAGALAKRLHSTVEAVYANEEFPSVLVGDQSISLTKSLERKILDKIHARIGRSAVVHMSEGRPADAILRVARKRRAGLIVMGTHGLAGFQPAILGWVAEMIARRSPIPVLTVRRAPGRMRSILVAVHEDERAGQELEFAAELARRLGVPLQALYFGDGEGGDAAARVAGMIRALPPGLRAACRLPPKVARGNAEKEILREARRHDLLVIVARRELLFKELLLGSTTDRVLQLSPVPVLTLPPRAHRRL